MDRYFKPKISVVLPTYNRTNTLPQAIDSVLQQSHKQFELLIVDDGSVDGTSKLVASYQDPRIYYFYQPHSGVSAARNFGIDRANSELIALLDSDDQWLPNKLELQLDYLNNNPQYRIVQSEEIWMRDGLQVNPKRKHLKQEGNLFEDSLHRCTITPSSLLADKNLLYECQLFDSYLPACEDYDLWLRITCKGLD